MLRSLSNPWLQFFCLLPILLSCGSSAGYPDEDEVRDVFELYVEGKYEKYVERIHSCINKPEDYKARMIELHRQHAAEQAEDGKQITSFSVGKMTQHDEGRMVNVYLCVSYADGTSEEIIFPMVFFDGNWWAQ